MSTKVELRSGAACLEAAQSALALEARAIEAASRRLDGSLLAALQILHNAPGKVVVTGLGKSGLIGQKIAATFCSTGTPAVFLHPSEAVHGDLGVYSPGEATILISKSGATEELVHLVPVLRQFKSQLIGILGNLRSPLGNLVDVALDASVAREADPCNIAPTASAVVALALCDALASALMVARNFTLEDYARLHPGGQLGRGLSLKVRDVMHEGPAVAWLSSQQSLKEVVIEMTRHALGAACVITNGHTLKGLITDGDVRRALQKYDDIRNVKAADIMTRRPASVLPDAPLREALRLMEDRPSQISVLPVIDHQSRCLGLVRIHDIYSGHTAST
jgi:arabinose-5-phosphate isomerase